MEDTQVVGTEDIATTTAEELQDKKPMTLADLIASAKDSGNIRLDKIGKRGEKPEEKKAGPRQPTTAEHFAKALEMVGEGNFVTVSGVVLIMEHNGWKSKSRSDREKLVAVKSAVYNRRRAGDEKPELRLPIDFSKSRDGLYAFLPVDKQVAEQAEQGDGTAGDPNDNNGGAEE